ELDALSVAVAPPEPPIAVPLPSPSLALPPMAPIAAEAAAEQTSQASVWTRIFATVSLSPPVAVPVVDWLAEPGAVLWPTAAAALQNVQASRYATMTESVDASPITPPPDVLPVRTYCATANAD